MSIQQVLQDELDVKRYVASIGLNPENTYYQSVQSRNISVNQANWQLTSPNKRSYLLSWAVVDWMPTIQKRREDGTTLENWGNSINHISFKPVLPFANAMSSITLSINGNTITLSQPRRFAQQLCWSCVNRDEAEVCYETGYPTALGGQINAADPGKLSRNVINDDTWLKNEASFTNKLLKANNVNFLGAFNATTISHQEPLLIAPFNPFLKIMKDMPSYLWFKNMSPIIPNIDRMELDIQFQDLTASVLYPRYMQSTAATGEFKFLNISALAANLKLWWYEVPVNMSIPRQVDIQTWNVREFNSDVTAVAEGVAVAQTRSALIQLNSTPTLICVSIRRDQDNVLYSARAASRSDTLANAPAAASVANAGNHSWDSYHEIESLEILLGDRPNVISTTFTQRELYYLTQKNSKRPYPYDFTAWAALNRKPTVDVNGVPDGAANYVTYGAKCCVMLRPKDLAEKISDGVFAPNSIQIIINSRARDGFSGITNTIQQTYRAYFHLFFGKHFLRIESDKAQFQEQSVPLNVARQLTNPVLQQQGVSGLGGALTGLRGRAGVLDVGGGLVSEGQYSSRV